jgi:gamma-glutamylcyclotransferase
MRARRIDIIGGRGVSARLSYFRLVFDKLSESLGTVECQKHGAIGYANVVPAVSGAVYGVLYILPKGPSGLAALDVYEGVSESMYARRTIPLTLQDGQTVMATTYLACPQACAAQSDTLSPTQSYLNHLLAGRALLPAEYHDQLARTKVSWMPDPALGVSVERALEVSEPILPRGKAQVQAPAAAPAPSNHAVRSPPATLPVPPVSAASSNLLHRAADPTSKMPVMRLSFPLDGASKFEDAAHAIVSSPTTSVSDATSDDEEEEEEGDRRRRGRRTVEEDHVEIVGLEDE